MNLTLAPAASSAPSSASAPRRSARFREADAICIEARAGRLTSAPTVPQTPELGQSALLILAQSQAVGTHGHSDAAFVAQSYRRLPLVSGLVTRI